MNPALYKLVSQALDATPPLKLEAKHEVEHSLKRVLNPK